jgi:hypothetical protein
MLLNLKHYDYSTNRPIQIKIVLPEEILVLFDSPASFMYTRCYIY